ncbi:ketosteroid isomerase-like protein [Saccharothrix tamanrassetensis]|uniref:Ketosteroid isomerase-like protein n=1 Tax=Saccharothrix tamanrassetensis TaxID=1051531 RepID=A0A841CTH0_9PSEU|nr:nuclear transport factor 2 family protein [Saccharothrix tamanrassetensis]MBB5960163.1 ketosteroid isomerase-like protein [Saccharothrix tamanrassetensis]
MGENREVATATSLRGLNHDVWEPFRSAYGRLDAAGFMAVHGPDLIRAEGAAKRVRGRAEYATEIAEWFARVAASGDSLGIAFRFLERLADGDAASERGIYRIDAVRAGAPKVFYGRFHVFCRRIDGRWRIVVDYDDEEGATEEVFASGAAMDDVTAFSE